MNDFLKEDLGCSVVKKQTNKKKSKKKIKKKKVKKQWYISFGIWSPLESKL